MARIRFPDGFLWGAATASYQIEGAYRADGKGPSIWDRFAHTPGKIATGETGDVACDHYHRWAEDVELMEQLHLSSYRFSIAWPRVQPDGRGAFLPHGLDFYGRLVDRLLEAGIRPFPTLYHWDLPQALEDVGGWPNRDTALRFAEYAHHVVERLGDRIDAWMIFNEPSIFTTLGYLIGMHAPGRTDMDAFIRATHTVNLAQGEAFRAMRDARADLRIGTAFNMTHCEPATDSEADHDAAERFHRFMNRWYLDPALRGRYPEAFRDEVPVDALGIQEGDMERVRAPLDFVGLNLYGRTIVANSPEDSPLGAVPVGMHGGDEGPKTDFDWEVWPQAIYHVLRWLTEEYDRPVIEITENGCSYADGPDTEGVVRDDRRIDYHRSYLAAVAQAIDEGADVRSYHAWTLIDNFEWAEGFRQRFGLVHVDHTTQKRTVKSSGRWYARVASENGFDV